MKILSRQEIENKKRGQENEKCAKTVKGEKSFKEREISVIYVGLRRNSIKTKS